MKFIDLTKKYYHLIAYCVIPNHVHLLFDIKGFQVEIMKVMQLINGRSAYLCNQVLGRKGAFWQRESYDHYVRNHKELENIEHYIVENPVKARLVENWDDWAFTHWNR